jgi:hypothetical protein
MALVSHLSRLVVEEWIDEQVGDCDRHEDGKRHNPQHRPPGKATLRAADLRFVGVVALRVRHFIQSTWHLPSAAFRYVPVTVSIRSIGVTKGWQSSMTDCLE